MFQFVTKSKTGNCKLLCAKDTKDEPVRKKKHTQGKNK